MFVGEMGMTSAGAHPDLMASIMEESDEMRMSVSFENCKANTAFSKSLKQGGKESPAVFRDCIIDCLAPIVNRWKHLRYGISL